MKTVILDIRGLLLNLYHSGNDKDSIMGDDGKACNTAGFGLSRFIEFIILNTIEESEVYPRSTLACWDDDNTRRKAIYPPYKVKRKADDKKRDLVSVAETDKLMLLAKGLLASLGYTQILAPACEADDVISMLCGCLPGEIEVKTIDADLLALSSKNVLVHLKGDPIIGEHKGVPLELITLEKSIVGDRSDCYPGIKGMGSAAFTSLLGEFEIEGMLEIQKCVATSDYSLILESLEVEESRNLRKLYDNRHDWEIMFSLASLHPEWVGKPFAKKKGCIKYFKRIPSKDRLREVLEKANCMDYFERLEELCPTSWLIDSETFEEADLKEAVEAFAEGPIVAFDYESFDPVRQESLQIASKNKDFVDVLRQVPVGASFCFGANYESCFYVTTGHKDSNNLPNRVLGQFLAAAEKSGTPLVAHNESFEVELTERECEYSPKKVMDTVIMSAYADENLSAHLKSLSKELLGYKQQTFLETLGDKANMSELTAEECAFPYGCDDAIVTAHLWDLLRLKMMIEGTWDFYVANQPDAERVLIEAKREGTPLDEEELREYVKSSKEGAEEAMGKLLPLLLKNCNTPNPAAVDSFIKVEVKPYLVAKNKDQPEEKKLNLEQINSRVASEKEKLLGSCVFVPPTEEVISSSTKWLPTVKGLEKVCGIVGITPPVSVAVSRLADYIEGVYSSGKISSLAGEFLRVLGPAANQLKGRKGENYETFLEFCADLIDKEAAENGTTKTIKHGTHIEVGSYKKMQAMLYCMMGLPVRRHSKITDFKSFRATHNLKGSPGTDVLAMDTAKAYDMKEGDWRIEALDYLRIIKTDKTYNGLYFKPYPNWVYTSDKMLHPSIKNCGTVTRRPSGGTPNLLQVSGYKDGGRLRSCFPAQRAGWKKRGEEPHVVVAIDFSQQELRIMASECQDETMMGCYIGSERRDIHSQSAVGIISKVNKLHLDYDHYVDYYENPELEHHKLCVFTRKAKAKETNFLIGYGGGALTLSERLIITLEEANLIFDAVMETYPGITPWQRSVAKFAKLHGYTETAFGNRRHIDAKIFSSNKQTVARAERQLINATIQGCAADILVKVLGIVRRIKLMQRTRAKLIAPVYDEFVSRVPVSTVVTYINEMTEIMSLTPPGHAVPMEADVSIGINWGSQVEIGINPTEDSIMETSERVLTEGKD